MPNLLFSQLKYVIHWFVILYSIQYNSNIYRANYMPKDIKKTGKITLIVKFPHRLTICLTTMQSILRQHNRTDFLCLFFPLLETLLRWTPIILICHDATLYIRSHPHQLLSVSFYSPYHHQSAFLDGCKVHLSLLPSFY